jgi:hypothetical protein
MKRKRLPYYAVLLVALGALVWDRTCHLDPLAAPEPVPAGVSAAALRPAAAPPQASGPAASPPATASDNPVAGLQRLLTALAHDTAAPPPQDRPGADRNLFAPTARFLAAAPRGSSSAEKQGSAGREAVLAAARQWRLSGTLLWPGRSWAMINDQPVRLGGNIGPAQLLAVGPDYAVLQFNPLRIVLFLDGRPPALLAGTNPDPVGKVDRAPAR